MYLIYAESLVQRAKNYLAAVKGAKEREAVKEQEKKATEIELHQQE
jgi:hypothetical protein